MKLIFFISNLVLNLSAFKEATDLYIIGDSLSDNGNTFELTGGKNPNVELYPSHRFSNGPVWNDYLAEKYRNLKIKNYAVGGATADNDIINLVPGIPSLKDQALSISNELSKSTYKKCKPNKGSKKLAVIWTGGNDLFANFTIASKTIIPSLMSIVEILKQTQKFDNILVFNILNIVHAPFGSILPPAEVEGINQAIIQLNQALAKAVNDVQTKDYSQKLTLVDFDQIAAKLTSTASLKSLNWEPFGYCVDDLDPLSIKICNYPNNYFFWDKQHPNTVSHERISNELEAVFKQLGYI